MPSNTAILDRIQTPEDMRELSIEELKILAHELRQETITQVSKTGGHLGAGLGVIELTVALHHIFDTPKDKLIWDVGHQSYPHKILTGRRDAMPTLRQEGGLSGFTKRGESAYDPFGAGHSSTSISAALGMAVARDLSQPNEAEEGHAPKPHEVIAVIGDGAMSAGMAYEALNNAGAMRNKLIVILNDNEMSIAPAVGAMSAYLARMISSQSYTSFRNVAKKAIAHLPHYFERAVKKTEQYAKSITTAPNTNFFEELGFTYVGPIDGHNLDHLLPILKNVQASQEPHPFLIHVVTEKGHGFDSPDASSEKFHAVKQFDHTTHIQVKSSPSAPPYQRIFAEQLIQEAASDAKIVGITAAMPSGTSMDLFGKAYPDRMFDVGIAEQHAVTFAAGLAAEGYKPFCAIYSTFLQRAYDQIVHDVAIQKLPVRFAIDRAGLVGADGPTHAGSFDITYLACLPDMVVMAPSDEAELIHMVHTAAHYDEGPCTFRYPRGEGTGCDLPATAELLTIGKGRILQEGEQIAILNFGTRMVEAQKAASILEQEHQLRITIADARFAKPLDLDLINTLAKNHHTIFTLEEGSIGGFGSHVLHHAAHDNIRSTCHILPLCLPDRFQAHAAPNAMYTQAGLDAAAIVQHVRQHQK